MAYSAGVVCPGCKVRLRIVERRAKDIALYLVISGLLLCALASLWTGTIMGEVILGIGAIALVLGFFPSLYARRFLTADVRTGNDVVDFPVERLKEELEIATGTRDDPSAAMLAAVKDYWACSHCGEPNPNVSGLCFSCGRHNAAAI